jgi:hypothetical protein
MRSRATLGLSFRCIFIVLLFTTLLVRARATGQSKDTGKGTGDGSNQSQADGNQSTDQTGAKGSKSTDNSSSGDKSSTGKGQNTSADTAPIQSEVLAFRALRADAAKIFARVHDTFAGKGEPKAKSVLIYDSALYKMIPTYRALNGQFGLIIQKYCSILNQPSVTVIPPKGQSFSIALTPILAGADAANKTIAGILDTLKTTTELTPNSFTVTDDALASEVAHLFKSTGDTKNVDVFYPGVYGLDFAQQSNAETPTDVSGACDLTKAVTATQRLYALIFLRSAADSLSQTLQNRLTDLGRTVDAKSKSQPKTDVEKEINQKEIENANAEKDQWQAMVKTITEFNKATDAFLATLSKADSTGATPLLNNLFAAERLAAALAKAGAYTLELKIQKSGGEMIKKSNLFYGTRFYYGGGSIVTFFLFNADGAIISSGNFWSATTYVRDKSLKSVSE